MRIVQTRDARSSWKRCAWAGIVALLVTQDVPTGPKLQADGYALLKQVRPIPTVEHSRFNCLLAWLLACLFVYRA